MASKVIQIVGLSLLVCSCIYRQMCAVKFLHLEDFFDNTHHGMPIELEPKGIMFAEVCISLYFSVNSKLVRSYPLGA